MGNSQDQALLSHTPHVLGNVNSKQVMDTEDPPLILQLVARGQAGLFAVFGGQGIEWLPELTVLYTSGCDELRSFIRKACELLNRQSKLSQARTLGLYREGFDVISWIENQKRVPSSIYRASAPISYPLIGLTQLANYYDLMLTLGVTPRVLRSYFAGASGHSQGVVSAAVVASSATFDEFERRSLDAVAYLFWHGARVQQVARQRTLSAKIVAESKGTSGGVPTPMLSVLGLPLAKLTEVLKSVNRFVPPSEQVHISLFNAPDNVVVSGPPRSLHSLRQVLLELRADPDDNQGRVPFSERKPHISMRYLSVSVPFHSPHCEAAIGLIAADVERLRRSSAANGGSGGGNGKSTPLFSAASFAIPVLSTVDGSDLRDHPNALASLIEMQCTRPVRWDKTCAAITKLVPAKFTRRSSAPFQLEDDADANVIVETPSPRSKKSKSSRQRKKSKSALRRKKSSPRASVGEDDAKVPPAAVFADANSANANASAPLFAAARRVTHVMDFGPGGSYGSGKLVSKNVEGLGVAVIHIDPTNGQTSQQDDAQSPAAEEVDQTEEEKVAAAASATAKKLHGVLHVEEKDLTPEPWQTEHLSPVVRREIDNGKPFVENAFTRTFGAPNVFVPGMTPTTASAAFCAEVTAQGFHIELAGGGQHLPELFRSSIETISERLPPGRGITVNLLFLNPYLWNFQFPLILQMRGEGHPIQSITIAAGMPGPEKCDEIITQLQSVGIDIVSFKPASIGAIEEVCDVAARHPTMKIGLQWTGGQSGGHHSCEDQHHAVLQTYRTIRKYPNIILIVGGGVSSPEIAASYCSGSWSTKYGRAPMPFDAVLTASRIMVSKEAETELAVKKLIVGTPGVDDDGSTWEQSFKKSAGGVVTVKSELGEPIHKLYTRGMALWKEIDDKFLSLPPAEAKEKIAANKQWIIERINADFQKPYFAQNLAGQTLQDVHEMTYYEVAVRFLDFFWSKRDSCWVDITYYARWRDWCFRIIERFASESAHLADAAHLKALQDAILCYPKAPFPAMDLLKEFASVAHEHLISAEDEDFFLFVCLRPRMPCKPINFVPYVDEFLKFYFKKDSLWFSEDLSSVPDNDANRVCVLQGPVAARHSHIVNEPIASILGDMSDAITESITKVASAASASLGSGEHRRLSSIGAAPSSPSMSLSRRSDSVISLRSNSSSGVGDFVVVDRTDFHSASASPSPVAFSLAPTKKDADFVRKFGIRTSTSITFDFSNVEDEASLPSARDLHEFLTGDKTTDDWLQTVFFDNIVVRGKKWTPNRLGSLFEPAPGRRIVASWGASKQITALRLFDANLAESLEIDDALPLVALTYDESKPANAENLTLKLIHPRSDASKSKLAKLELRFRYSPARGFRNPYLMEEAWESRAAKIQQFYADIWLDEKPQREFTVSGDHLARFRTAIGHLDFTGGLGSASLGGSKLAAPIDYAIVLAWDTIVRELIQRTKGVDLLSLLHLSNEFVRLENPVRPIVEGERLTCSATLDSVWDDDKSQRRIFTVRASLARKENGGAKDATPKPVLDVISSFGVPFVACGAAQPDGGFFKTEASTWELRLDSDATKEVFLSKKWHAVPRDSIETGSVLSFDISHTEHTQGGSTDGQWYETRGKVTVRGTSDRAEKVVALSEITRDATACPIVSFLERRATRTDSPSLHEEARHYEPVTERQVFGTAFDYAVASKDYNPIHTNPYFASFAGLPSTIQHGMLSSAVARQVVEQVSASGLVSRLKCTFLGVVNSDTEPQYDVQLVGMKNGLKVMSVTVTDGPTETVLLKAEAEVAQPKTAFVFTGQGSAEVKMGMDLYAESPIAKSIWDEADAHFRRKYGFSILRIVRDNPTELFVPFSGSPEHVRALREHYAALHVVKKGNQSVALYPDAMNPDTKGITFQSAGDGLLFSTQFQQPAILLAEKAAYEDLRAKGVIDGASPFAGHSLGEYGALACTVSSLSIPQFAEIVFLRGLTMQSVVARDDKGRSRYGMVAVSPSRIHKRFPDKALGLIVDALERECGELLQIVNHNIRHHQFVIAGGLVPLEALRVTLDALRAEMLQEPTILQNKEAVKDIVADAAREAKDLAASSSDGFIRMRRGKSTIPLQGIDVPFHSRLLMDGVSSFRKVLEAAWTETTEPRDLVGRYIPNLVGKPFALTKAFVKEVYDATKSPVLADVLVHWKANDSPARRPRVCSLLVIELLAYQFASPVMWIDTQDALVRSGVQRFVEIGPQPTLLTFFQRTYPKHLGFEFLWSGRDTDAIFCREEGMSPAEFDALTSGGDAADEDGDDEEAETSAAAPAAAAAGAVAAAPVAAAGPVEMVSVPMDVLHSMRVIISMKTKRKLAQVDPSQTVRMLANGKSALQNEILGDFATEFKAEPENAGTTPLTDLSQKVGGSVSYTAPGKVLSTAVHKAMSVTMPGGFGTGKVKKYLSTVWRLKPDAIDGVLIHTAQHGMRPATRFGGDADAKAWLDAAVVSFGQVAGVPMAKAAAGGSAGGGAQQATAAVVDVEEVNKINALFREQKRMFDAYFATPTAESDVAAEADSANKALDNVSNEHDSTYLEGILPRFDAKKVRHYNSWWNWARRDAFELLQGRQSNTDAGAASAEAVHRMCNRATTPLLNLLQESNSAFAQHLAPKVAAAIKASPTFCEFSTPMKPVSTVTKTGALEASEVPRYATDAEESKVAPTPAASKSRGLEELVRDMTRADNANRVKLKSALNSSEEARLSKVFAAALKNAVTDGVSFRGKTALVTGAGARSIGLSIVESLLQGGAKVVVTTSRPERKRWEMYRESYQRFGAKDSELIVLPFNAASSQDVDALVQYITLPKTHAAGGLGLGVPSFVIPFAAIPVEGRDVGMIDGRAELAQRAMLTNLVRLIGAFKNFGERQATVQAESSVVVLPLSPNHGMFGNDGLYAETKIGLETLFHKWRSEGWSSTFSVIGVEIGWTRGTGLMNQNDIVSAAVESECGVRTFSLAEMSLFIATLLSPAVVECARAQPLRANFNGGFGALGGGDGGSSELPVARIRADLMRRAEIQKAIFEDSEIDRKALKTANADESKENADEALNATPKMAAPNAERRSAPSSTLKFPKLSKFAELPKSSVQGLNDLDDAVVVVGFGEVGPWGSARTRWEYEVSGEFSAYGAIELARSMGLIEYAKGKWIDTKTKKEVRDADVSKTYMAHFQEHCGIRPVNADLFRGYSPAKKTYLQQMALESDMPPFEIHNADEAEYFRLYHGSKVNVEEKAGGGSWLASLKKGSVIYVPKVKPFDRLIAGQLPTGWDSKRYGIPEDIASQADIVTQYALAAAMDAFNSAGLLDPYELYEHVHVSEVGNTVGGGMGGMRALEDIFRRRYLEEPGIAADSLQETFINTTAAWINMLLVSSSGPIKTPVAACATAATSVEIALETIQSGKARVMICGGTEDFGEQGSFEFAQMKATSSGVDELAQGREPNEHCRPATSTRGGFMESQGAGVQILTTASLALKMGLPIYAVLGGAWTATDREGRSVPAPGQGILSTTKEFPTAGVPSPLLDSSYRARQYAREVKQVQQWYEEEMELATPKTRGSAKAKAGSVPEGVATFLSKERTRRLKGAQRLWGLHFHRQNDEIAPLRGALAAWGLTADDLDVCSFHGTGTAANDDNESDVVNQQMKQLGRRPGNVLPTIWQKWLTGHPKGAAAAWMLHGVLQSMLEGVIPGNRNADNIDPKFASYEYLLYLDRSIKKPAPLRAGYIHSFGFGQAGAEVLVIHPGYLYAALPAHSAEATYAEYAAKRRAREQKAEQRWIASLCGKGTLVPIQTRAPFDLPAEKSAAPPSKEEEKEVARASYLNPTVRATRSYKDGSYQIMKENVGASSQTQQHASMHRVFEQTVAEAAATATASGGGGPFIGTDLEEIAMFDEKDSIFKDRNYTPAEQAYCSKAPHPSASYAGKWCAKEAVVKALTSVNPSMKGAWSQTKTTMLDIEVVNSNSGAPQVRLKGYAARLAESLRVERIQLSISHTTDHAQAVAVAFTR